jgi:hypothetical protein
VNYDADSVFYKLSIDCKNEEYFQDEKSNLLFLVTREVKVLNKNFGGYEKANLSEAKKYSIENKDKFDGGNVYLVTKISIRKKDGFYDDVWVYKNIIDIHEEDNSYSIYELKIFLEDSYAEYNGKVQSRLHINFKTVDYDDGYKLYTLNYIYKDNLWQLVSRERICTIPQDINKEEIGYCRDTINDNCVLKAKKFDLTNDYIMNYSHLECN